MAAYGADADSVAAYLPVSGQTVTHFTIRKERGLPDGIPVVDEYAPVNKARKETAPLVLITGDKHLEMAARYEENALLEAVLKSIGNKESDFVRNARIRSWSSTRSGMSSDCRLCERDSNDILFWQEVRYMWYEFTTYMVFTPEQNPHYLCHILKQEKFKTDIYGKDSKKIDGFGR